MTTSNRVFAGCLTALPRRCCLTTAQHLALEQDLSLVQSIVGGIDTRRWGWKVGLCWRPDAPKARSLLLEVSAVFCTLIAKV